MTEYSDDGGVAIALQSEIARDPTYGLYFLLGFMPRRDIEKNRAALCIFEGGMVSSGLWYREHMKHMATWGICAVTVTVPQPSSKDIGMWTRGFELARDWATQKSLWGGRFLVAAGHSWGANIAEIWAAGRANLLIMQAVGWPFDGTTQPGAEELMLAPTKVDCPSVILYGSEDQTTGERAADEHLKRIEYPGCDELVMEGGIHASFISNPTAYAAAAMIEGGCSIPFEEQKEWVRAKNVEYINFFTGVR